MIKHSCRIYTSSLKLLQKQVYANDIYKTSSSLLWLEQAFSYNTIIGKASYAIWFSIIDYTENTVAASK